MGDFAEDPFPEEEQQTLQQYSKALNVYNDDETEFGRIFVNPVGDELEVNYKGGLGAVHFPGAVKYTKDFVKYDLADRLYCIDLAVQDEKKRAEGAEGDNSTAISNEKKRAEDAEAKNAADILAENVRAGAAELQLTTDLATETAARIGAVQTLTANITSEANTRSLADNLHTSSIQENKDAISA